MSLDFFKYQGAGNDFVIIDNRKNIFPKDNYDLIRSYCDRKFGIGADGLMLLETASDADFNMIYFNADGRPGSMCGNGGRCIVAFAKTLGLFDTATSFNALGEIYRATIQGEQVSLAMQQVEQIHVHQDHAFLDTGSPHYVTYIDNLNTFDVVQHGRSIRNNETYKEAGTNVNFVERINENTFSVRTYERGVEDETLSCGTGVTAVALASYHLNKTNQNKINIETPGGKLSIDFKKEGETYKDIILTGPATFVFKGTIELS